ncbi:uncharacterized protein LOC129612030 [Condylostylus longicornis]|uniref:uncharacterized protein LOC129612030 n=1 Tax=Condylostylus longicornis TaxID=2530218 RepID=UPI00244E4175|nr:uncharacterized protein LOC129612030 [Condylostylus longicornis]
MDLYCLAVILITTLLSYYKPLSVSLLLLITVLFLNAFVIPVIGQENDYNYQLKEENIRFAFQRCQNESNADTRLILLWNVWKFPDNKLTHCYIKCIFYKLGLINLKDMGLNKKKFMLILKRSNTALDALSMSDLTSYNKLVEEIFKPLDSTCESYYKMWVFLIDRLGINDIRNGFTNLRNSAISKPVGQKASDFCYNYSINYFYSETISDFSIFSNFSKCLEKCIYQYFHFIDAYGRVDVKEILQSYSEVNQISLKLGSKIDMSPRYRIEIEKCAHYANARYYQGLCLVASKLHKCLKENVKSYSTIFKYRDELTIYY